MRKFTAIALMAASTASTQAPFPRGEVVATNETGAVYRVAGNGTVQFLASVGSFAGGIDFDYDGTVVCAGRSLVRIDSTGTITTIVTSIPTKAYEVEVGPQGNYWLTSLTGRTVGEYSRGGVFIRAIGFGEPMWGLGYDSQLDRFYACGSTTLFAIDRSPTKTTTLATGAMILQGAHFSGGILYVGDDGSNSILGFDRQGVVTTLLSGAPFGDPGEGVDAYPNGDLLITDDTSVGGNALFVIGLGASPTITTLTAGGPLPNLNSCAVRPELVVRLRGTNPRVGQTATLDVTSTSAAGESYAFAASLSTQRGFPLPGQRTFPLDLDGLFFATALNQIPSVFRNFQGTLDDAGGANPTIAIPPFPRLAGITLFVAGMAFHPAGRGGIHLVTQPAVQITIQP